MANKNEVLTCGLVFKKIPEWSVRENMANIFYCYQYKCKFFATTSQACKKYG